MLKRSFVVLEILKVIMTLLTVNWMWIDLIMLTYAVVFLRIGYLFWHNPKNLWWSTRQFCLYFLEKVMAHWATEFYGDSVIVVTCGLVTWGLTIVKSLLIYVALRLVCNLHQNHKLHKRALYIKTYTSTVHKVRLMKKVKK